MVSLLYADKLIEHIFAFFFFFPSRSASSPPAPPFFVPSTFLLVQQGSTFHGRGEPVKRAGSTLATPTSSWEYWAEFGELDEEEMESLMVEVDRLQSTLVLWEVTVSPS